MLEKLKPGLELFAEKGWQVAPEELFTKGKKVKEAATKPKREQQGIQAIGTAEGESSGSSQKGSSQENSSSQESDEQSEMETVVITRNNDAKWSTPASDRVVSQNLIE